MGGEVSRGVLPRGYLLAVEAELTPPGALELWLGRVPRQEENQERHGGGKAWGRVDQDCLWGQQRPCPPPPA